MNKGSDFKMLNINDIVSYFDIDDMKTGIGKIVSIEKGYYCVQDSKDEDEIYRSNFEDTELYESEK